MTLPSVTKKHLSTLSDSELIGAYLQGEELALEVLMQRRSGVVRAVLRRFARNLDEDAYDDLAQQVWVRVAKHAARFNHVNKFSTWVCTIARNLAINAYRDSRRHGKIVQQRWPQYHTTEDGLEEVDIADAQPASRADFETNYDDFRTFVEKRIKRRTSVKQREVLHLRGAGHSYGEIARLTGMPEGTVKSNLNRGRAAVAKLYREYSAQ